MYTIYADGNLLYAPNLFHEGYGVFSPKLTVELNKAGSLEYTMPPSNVLYDDLNKLKTIITVNQNGEELFRGRVLHDEKDFYKQKSVYCEGELAFLLDSKQRPYTFSGTIDKYFRQLISNHNARVDAAKKFTVGKVTISGNINIASTDYPNTFDEINNQIIETVGGYIQTRLTNGTRYIDLLADLSDSENISVVSQTIEFGVNLLDISEYITAENIFTVLIPLGATVEETEEKLTIAGVNNGKDYVEDTTAINLFGRIEEKQDWNEVEDASELKKLGQDLLSKNIEMAVTLTVKAVDLYLLGAAADRIRLGDWVRVISLPHGLDKEFQCTKIVYDLENPDQNEYSFGVNYTSMTDQQVNNEKSIKSSVSTVMSAASSVNASVSKANQAAANAENVIATLPTEYVQTTTFEAYKTETAAKFDKYASQNDLESLQTNLENLITRVEILEGGTA